MALSLFFWGPSLNATRDSRNGAVFAETLYSIDLFSKNLLHFQFSLGHYLHWSMVRSIGVWHFFWSINIVCLYCKIVFCNHLWCHLCTWPNLQTKVCWCKHIYFAHQVLCSSLWWYCYSVMEQLLIPIRIIVEVKLCLSELFCSS